MADSRMGEEEAYCNQKLEEMIKEVRKNVGVTHCIAAKAL